MTPRPPQRPNPAPKKRREVLITGMPNFVAVRLLWTLLDAEPKTHVALVVRGDLVERTEAELSRRVGVRSRVRVLRGDVVAPDLGLVDEDLERVLRETTDIYHLASIYHLGVAKNRAEEVNIQGTRHVLDIARRCDRLERLNHYSTAFVAGDRVGVILEGELETGQKFRNTFERTKFTAELEIRRAMHDLPISVYRPSMLVGDSETGEIDALDGPYFFFQLIVNNPTRLPVPLPSAAMHPLNVVPVDYVTRAMHAISIGENNVGRTFHLVDPNPISARDAFRMIAEHAERSAPRGRMPHWLAQRLLALPPVERLTRQGRAFLHELDSLTIFNSMNTMAALRHTGIIAPPFPTYVDRLVRYVQRDRTWGDGDASDLL